MPTGADSSGLAAFVTRWAPLFDGASEPCVVLRPEGWTPVYANDAALTAFGEHLKQRVAETLPEPAREALRERGLWRGRDVQGWMVHALALGAVEAPVGFSLTWTPEACPPLPWPDTLRRLVDLSADLLVGVEENGRIVYRNGQARAFFPSEVLGRRARDVLRPAALEAIGGGAPAPEEAVDASGGVRVLLWKGLPLEGEPLPAVAVGRDVTEAHVATHRLENRMKRLEAMHGISLALGRGEPLSTLHEMALARLAAVVPLELAVLYELTGRREEPEQTRLIGLHAWERGRGGPVDEALSLADHPAAEAVNSRAPVLLTAAGPSLTRWPAMRALAERGGRAAAAVPLCEESRVLGVLWLGTARARGFSEEDVEAAQELAGLLVNAMVRQRLQDRIAGYTRELEARVEARTSELRSTQEQLLAAARLSSIGELSAGIAHELNQPLNVITGYLELLQDGELDPDESTRALTVMSSAAERMAGLVRHLRDFSRAGVETLRGVDLRQVVDMARDLTARATRRPIAVRWERPETPLTVLGDPGRLEQLFINLLVNAMQATEAAGGAEVAVRVRRAGEELHVEIADQGPGVPEHLRHRIFEPFFTTKERGQGTGLGLSISAKIASEHQGRVDVGEAPGGGAVFRVVLPGYRMA